MIKYFKTVDKKVRSKCELVNRETFINCLETALDKYKNNLLNNWSTWKELHPNSEYETILTSMKETIGVDAYFKISDSLLFDMSKARIYTSLLKLRYQVMKVEKEMFCYVIYTTKINDKKVSNYAMGNKTEEGLKRLSDLLNFNETYNPVNVEDENKEYEGMFL